MARPANDIDGLWPLLRCDARLSGHQPLAGAIAKPVVRWRHYLGGPHFDGALIARGRAADLLLPFGGCLHCYDALGTLRWKSDAIGVESIVGIEDVDDDGRVEIVASNGKSVFVLDASNGEVLWTEYLGPPNAGGFMHTAARLHRFDGFERGMQLAIGLLSSKEVVVFDFGAGARAPERHTILWMDDFFHPSLLVADLDGDGRDELVVTKLSAIYVFVPATGAPSAECHWATGGGPKRNYGMLEAVDVDGDGALDLVVISDRVSRHIAVVANDGRGGLTNRWDRFVEHIYDGDERELRFVASSVVDLDGDGRVEIVVSLFDERGDGRWWLEVIDASSGRTRIRHADAYLRGIDRETPGAPVRILTSRETTRVPAERGTIEALELDDDRLRTIWSHADAAFVGRFAEAAPTRAFFRTDLPPADDVRIAWLDGEPLIAFVDREGLGFLSLRYGTTAVRRIDATGDVVSVIAVGDLDGDGHDELVVSEASGGITIMQADGTVIGSLTGGMRLRPGTGPYYMAKPMSTPVVTADRVGRYCAVPDAAGRVHVLAWSDQTDAPRPLGVAALRGRVGPEEAYHAVSWYVREGGATLVGAALDEGEDAGRARIVTVEPRPDAARGETLTVSPRWTVADVPRAGATHAARTGIHDYALVDVDGRSIVVVSGFRSPSMNSEATVAIDAETGAVLWRLDGIEMPGHILGPGPWSAMSIDRKGGRTRLHFLAKDTLCMVDAATGAMLAEPVQLRGFNSADMRRRGLTMDDFSAYGSVVPMELGGSTARLLVGNYGGHGLVDEEGTVRWWHSAPLSSLTGSFGGVADLDGDGRLELGASDATGDLVCLDVGTGVEKWRLHLAMVATGIATCDIDGCGRPELVVATREGVLLAVGVSSSGVGFVKWRIDLGYSLGPPVVADFDGDGASEVLVVCGDGWLRSIGAVS